MGKVKAGCGFKGTVQYALDCAGLNDKDARLLHACNVDIPRNFSRDNASAFSAIARSFRMQALLDPRVKKPVRHLVLSCKKEDRERMTPEEWVSVTEDYLERMGILNTQYIIVEHLEKDNPHVHVVFNIVDRDGHRINDSFFWKRNSKVCREITQERGYAWGDKKAISKAEDIHAPQEAARYELARKVSSALAEVSRPEDLEMVLLSKGIFCSIGRDSAGRPVGVRFSFKASDGSTYTFAGSKLDRNLSYGNIAKAIAKNAGYERALDDARAVAGNAEVLLGCPLPEEARQAVMQLVQAGERAAEMDRKLEQGFPGMSFPRLILEPDMDEALWETVAPSETLRHHLSRLLHGSPVKDLGTAVKAVSLIAPPTGRPAYGARSSRPAPITDDERQAQKDTESQGALDATLVDRRYVHSIF